MPLDATEEIVPGEITACAADAVASRQDALDGYASNYPFVFERCAIPQS
jgi:hypothetical protein